MVSIKDISKDSLEVIFQYVSCNDLLTISKLSKYYRYRIKNVSWKQVLRNMTKHKVFK